MPSQSDRLTELRDSAPEGAIPYISKSRVKKFVTCPEQFRYSYVQGLKEPESTAMARGTTIHEVIEDYYHAVTDFVETHGEYPEDLVAFLPEWERWADYTEPYITNFLRFEYERMGVSPDPETWLPVGIEAEAWMGYGDEPAPVTVGEQAPPWMGYADAIYDDRSVAGVEPDGGVVITDFKTGKTPLTQYRDEGIYLEGEYYAILFERDWDVTAVAGYYPKNDDLVISPLDADRRAFVYESVEEMLTLVENQEAHFPIDEQPLCKWGPGRDNQCTFYDICSSRWGEPGKHEDRFRDLVDQGLSPGQIAGELDTSPNAVNYWKKKLNV